MVGQTITIPMEQFMGLLELNANVNALQNYVKAERYPDRKVMCDIVGVKYEGDD